MEKQTWLEAVEKSAAGRLLWYFDQISRIPRASGNCRAIGEYLLDRASMLGLESVMDQAGNVLVWKPASPGCRNLAPVILQGHMDMVAVQDGEWQGDFANDGLELALDGDMLYARHTSLGGDNGVALALCLALMESEEAVHPPLELVFTVDEETGMDGARALESGRLSGRRMINLDSEGEGVFLAGCAGGMRVVAGCSYAPKACPGRRLILGLEGLAGGHSGMEIDQGGANAHVEMGKWLMALHRERPLALQAWEGGAADNAICAQSRVALLMPEEDLPWLKERAAAWEAELRQCYGHRDKDLALRWAWDTEGTPSDLGLAGPELEELLRWFCSMPSGVVAHSRDMGGLVETSLNLGVLRMRDGHLQGHWALRSSKEEEKYRLAGQMKKLLEDGICLGRPHWESHGDYPGWAYNPHSSLLEQCARVYARTTGRQARIEAIHAGLECGFFCQKIPGLDCVSLGPDMWDIHTPRERLSISSLERIWEFLLALLAEME